MNRRIGEAQVAATRPLSALISAAFLLLAVVAGVSGVAGFADPAAAATPVGARSITSTAAASTTSIPLVTERRSVTVLGASSGSRPELAGWAPHHPEHADLPVAPPVQPARFVQAPVRAGPSVVVLTIQVSHRGRAPPAGSLLT